MTQIGTLPPQQLSFLKKTKDWRKKHLDWADSRTYFNDNIVRKSVLHKRTNYNLLNGILDMNDMKLILNPENIKANFVPDTIQHYPIMNAKLNILRGEESKRNFSPRGIVTNPDAVTEIENNKKMAIMDSLKQLMQSESVSQEDFNAKLERLNEYYTYEWQDFREMRVNFILKHYIKELSLPMLFNQGFMDAMTVAEEIYQCDIVSGEPVVERINPEKIRIYKSGFSNKIEDADIIVLEDFWSPGRIVDTYYDVLSPADVKYIEDLPTAEDAETANLDERNNFINYMDIDGSVQENAIIDNYVLFTGPSAMSGQYFDNAGNVKVLRVYWKSRRKIKKVKSYDPQTGEELFNFYPEDYVLRTDLGEEEEILWINEAWEGTKIGKEVYVNMRPRPVQYNRLSNPSKCHFGIIGSLYNLNDSKPYSLVDMMKPYNYLYDAIHDRLNKSIAANWGRILELDLAMVPKGWDIEKWLYYAKVAHIGVKDSFNEGNVGQATGKLAGGFANSSRGVIDAETGNNIQNNINLLEFIKMEMAEVAGISKQREGQVSNRETVGGVERANLQSSHITEWLFMIHEDIKRRVLECLVETTKIAMKGSTKKFQYILSDQSMQIMNIDGDEFAECDYGIVIDDSNATQLLASKMDALAQAALQNQTLSFSTIMKIYTNDSLADTQRLIEKDEMNRQQAAQQSAQANRDSQMQIAQMEAQQKELDRQQKEGASVRDNDTKLLIAQMQQYAQEETSEDVEYSPEKKAALEEKIREFNEAQQQKRKEHEDKVALEKEDQSIRKMQRSTNNNKQGK